MSEPISPSDVKPDAPTRPPRRRRRRWLLRIAGACVLLAITGELVGRFALGLGDPPLMMRDSKIEYLFQPNQTVRRFGNAIHYNAYSMRADDFPKTKSAPDELRIFMIGDSVINGGAQTDQSLIASSILQRELSEKLKRKVVVGNASASSWGPANELEYMNQSGLLDADVLVIVVSSHDVVDVPTFAPSVGVSPDMPDHKPLCATSELITRYALPKLGIRVGAGDAPPAAPTSQPTREDPDVRKCLADFGAMIEKGKSGGARVIVALHIERAEAGGKLLPGHDMFRAAAVEAGAEIVDLAPAFDASLKAGRDPWRDAIHPNATGQRVMADVLEPLLLDTAVAPR